jgi:hypothetical protein
MDIVELIYRPPAIQGPSKDYEFLRAAMRRRWNQGLSDASAALARAPWLEPAPAEVAVRTFDVARTKGAEAAAEDREKSSPREPTRQRATTHG